MVKAQVAKQDKSKTSLQKELTSRKGKYAKTFFRKKNSIQFNDINYASSVQSSTKKTQKIAVHCCKICKFNTMSQISL